MVLTVQGVAKVLAHGPSDTASETSENRFRGLLRGGFLHRTATAVARPKRDLLPAPFVLFWSFVFVRRLTRARSHDRVSLSSATSSDAAHGVATMTTPYRVSFVFCTLLALSHGAPPSKLVKIACQRNPSLSFCDQAAPAETEAPNRVVKVNSSTSNERDEDVRGTEKPATVTEGLFALDKDTNAGATVENTTQEILGLKTFEETVIEEKGVTTPAPLRVAVPDDPILEEPLPKAENESSTEQQDKSSNGTEIPDDPTLEEMPEDKKKDRSELGSLLRLPKKKTDEEKKTTEPVARGSDLLIVPPPLPELDIPPPLPSTPRPVPSAPEVPASHNQNGTVLVFVSRFCVDNRERFVRKCKGEITMGDIEFCKGYPLACQATDHVIPIITYCQRYYKHYDKFCARQAPSGKVADFCRAFDKYCLPETADENADPGTASPSLKRCEDVQAQARQVCNPFPSKSDQFNFLRCQQFVQHCRKFVDWV
uniref:DB domain-containing protein n=1 Tax=Steinernema glaseri TaxID=37863 RepID=A0A1I7Z2R4_9BILA